MIAPPAWTDRQLPVGDEIFLDHVGYFTTDLAAAGAQLERLGFAVSPVNLQQNADAEGRLTPSGTSNRLAVLRRGFLEVLAATHDTPLGDQLKAALKRYTGLHLIALSHADIPAQRTRLTADGFAMQDVVHLRRHKQTPDGLREVRWSVLRPQPGVMPEGRVQFAYCHTPELTWPESAAPLANGADALTDILVCVADCHEAAARFGRFAGREPIEEGRLSVVPFDRGRVAFAEPSFAGLIRTFTLPNVPCMAGQAIRCCDLDGLRKRLVRAHISPLADDGLVVCVAAADALGSLLLFHDGSVSSPWAALAA
jgi:catechol 2,3-dioxygenase-like lactoylglutathione lyase family enzyme